MKTCRSCGLSLDESLFHLNNRKTAPAAICKSCHTDRSRLWRAANPERSKEIARKNYLKNRDRTLAHRKTEIPQERKRKWQKDCADRLRANWALYCFSCTRNNGKRLKRENDLSPEFLEELFAKQDGKCHWLGIPLRPSSEPRELRRPSVDRLDISRGYTRDNVVLACYFAQMGRWTSTESAFLEFINEVKGQLKAA